ncbi:MAG: GNAT family N-acetyltransferase [Halomonas sp.]|nr:GNAT family N-acetyltransferase [Halomonas sp.]TVP43088.1 MAG: GNAT family N-acetyltransferase [Halomonas sp.]
MKLIIRPATDKAFAETLTRQNMSAYYAQLDMRWDEALFEKGWRELDNYELVVDGSTVGILRLSRDENAYYIRELQIQQQWQCYGLGSQAIRFAIESTQQANIKLLRLRVFCTNPARALYERMGFRIRKTEGGMHYMERSVC